MVLNGEQHFQAMRPSVSRRGGQSPKYRETHGTGGRTSGIVGMPGLWCRLTSGHSPQRATISKTGGRLTRAPAGTNPTTGQAVVIFENLVPEVSSTSRSLASRRSVPRVPLRPVGGCGQVMLSQHGFHWYAVRSTVSFGIHFSLCVLVVYFHVSSSSSCVSWLERWKRTTSLWWWSFRTSRSSVSVLFMVLLGLSRMIVFGVAPLRTGRRKSPRRVCFWVTRRGPIGTSETCG